MEAVVEERRLAYSPSLDRLDVAIRAVIRMPRKGLWAEFEALGLSRDEDWEQLQDQLFAVDNLYSEDQLMRLVEKCPKLLEAANQLLKMYWDLTGESADWHYERRTFR